MQNSSSTQTPQPFSKEYTLPKIHPSMLECSVCNSPFSSESKYDRVAVMLKPCEDVFCLSCARDMVETKEGYIDDPRCFDCGQVINVSECVIMGRDTLEHVLIAKAEILRPDLPIRRMITLSDMFKQNAMCKPCSEYIFEKTTMLRVDVVPTGLIVDRSTIGSIKDPVQISTRRVSLFSDSSSTDSSSDSDSDSNNNNSESDSTTTASSSSTSSKKNNNKRTSRDITESTPPESDIRDKELAHSAVCSEEHPCIYCKVHPKCKRGLSPKLAPRKKQRDQIPPLIDHKYVDAKAKTRIVIEISD
jgi:hypothetical protein